MNVYYDYLINTSGIEGLNTDISWHPTKQILSIGNLVEKNGSITFYNKNGELYKDVIIKKYCGLSHFCWHKLKELCISGWDNGELVIIDLENVKYYENTSKSRNEGEIIYVHFVYDNLKLCSYDALGKIKVWKLTNDYKCVLEKEHIVNKQLYQILPYEDGKTSIIATNTSEIYIFKTNQITHLSKLNCVFKKILLSENDDSLIILTKSLNIIKYKMQLDQNKLVEIKNIKLSSMDPDNTDIIMCQFSTLAFLSGDKTIRLYDIDKNVNKILNVMDENILDNNETICCVCYSKNQKIIAAGTTDGHVLFWKLLNDDNWKFISSSQIDGVIGQLVWNNVDESIAVNTHENVYILKEHLIDAAHFHFTSVIQTGPTTLLLYDYLNEKKHYLKSDTHVGGFSHYKNNVVLWNERYCVIYSYDEHRQTLMPSGNFDMKNQSDKPIFIYEYSVYSFEKNNVIVVRNLQSTIKQTLSLDLSDSEIVTIVNVFSHFMILVSNNCKFAILDLSCREAKITQNFKHIKTDGTILLAKCNVRGNFVAFFTDCQSLNVWNVSTHNINIIKLDKNSCTDNLVKLLENGQVTNILWDETNENVLILTISQYDENLLKLVANVSCAIFFVMKNGDVVFYDIVPHIDDYCFSAIGLNIPNIYYASKIHYAAVKTEYNENLPLKKYVLSDFYGVDETDEDSIKSMLNFVVNLTTGHIEDALKSIKSVNNSGTWRNMAKLCIKSKRFKIARLCLSKLVMPYAIMTLDESIKNNENPNVIAGILAMHFNMEKEVVKFLTQASRYDLLIEYYKSINEWDKCIAIAKKFDRIRLRTVYFECAKSYENIGDIQKAILYYEKADCYEREITRLLMDNIEECENYIKSSNNKKLFKWWALYCESRGDLKSALEYYEKAEDYVSIVKIHCFNGDIEEAEKLCKSQQSGLVDFQMGSFYEKSDEPKKAVKFFEQAAAYGSAMRICKENGFDEKLLTIALKSRHVDQIQSAHYFASKADGIKSAIILYNKAGHFAKSIDLSLRNNQYDLLTSILKTYDFTAADANMIKQCANFYTSNQQFDKAVDLLAKTGQHYEAIELCKNHNVRLNNELAEKLILNVKNQNLSQLDKKKFMNEIGELAFSQAGEREKAFKSLVRTGEKNKIITYAKRSKNKQVWLMAANYLQTIDNSQDELTMKSIITFYTNANAYESLARYYDSRAQVEIDEFKNYKNAYDALNESKKTYEECLLNSNSNAETMLQNVVQKMEYIASFIKSKILLDTSKKEVNMEGIKNMQHLLQVDDMNEFVRIGDIYSSMICHLCQHSKFKQAYAIYKDMLNYPKLNVDRYISAEIVNLVHKKLNLGLPPSRENFNSEKSEIAEEIVEEN
ncbi:hypothetical protein A3Q56_03178 [Intoshia linei]|uniref:Intraflagellar transport protein 140 n=1 Tax=Intoshia linei TaxID=1819745 RepID=A0A177B464_9BILA|nr:hypothetical protein A3Q56_03178 [Intoshia linei]